ncbi:MAG: hypothetical protein PVG81_00950 [Desulfobacterales bacterium]|jgi:hypothetical protein
MEFLFVCPEENRSFESADLRIVDNRGVTTDLARNRMLDVKVALNRHCPFCGRLHVFRAVELACPFEGAT